MLIRTKVLPEAEGRVGEVGRAVKVPDSKAASNVRHGGQRHVASCHHTPLNQTLVGAIAKSHQAIVFIQTGREKKNWCQSKHIMLILYNPTDNYRVFSPSLGILNKPVTHNPPSGEPGLVADEGGVVRVPASQQGVGAHVTLLLPRGKVPEGDPEVLVACQSLQETHGLLIGW